MKKFDYAIADFTKYDAKQENFDNNFEEMFIIKIHDSVIEDIIDIKEHEKCRFSLDNKEIEQYLNTANRLSFVYQGYTLEEFKNEMRDSLKTAPEDEIYADTYPATKEEWQDFAIDRYRKSLIIQDELWVLSPKDYSDAAVKKKMDRDKSKKESPVDKLAQKTAEFEGLTAAQRYEKRKAAHYGKDLPNVLLWARSRLLKK